MKGFAVCGIVLLLASMAAQSSAAECSDSLPVKVCDHMKKLENHMIRLANRTTVVISKAVENAAEKNARLFKKVIMILKFANKTKPGLDIAKFLQELTENFKKIQEAQDEAAQKAVNAVKVASMKVANLIQKIIDDAVDGDHTDPKDFRRKLNMAVIKAHRSIRMAAYEAIKDVARTNIKARMMVIRMLKNLGLSMVTDLMPAVNILSDATDAKEADGAELELEADFDSVADDAYEVIMQADGGVSKRDWNDFWQRVKAAFQKLGNTVLEVIKKAVADIAPQIYEKLREIGKILLDTVAQVIVEIAGKIIVVNKT
eukprot:gene4617-5223_t